MKVEEKLTKQRTGIVHFEKRIYPRISVNLPVEYYQINSSSGQTGRALNALLRIGRD